MKSRPGFNMLLTIIVILTIGSVAYGQDAYEEPSIIEAEAFRIDDDRLLLSTPGELEHHYNIKANTKTPAKDTITAIVPAVVVPANTNTQKVKTEKIAPAPKATVQKQSKEEDDSIMSFHFLYYMIQKYKLQDIVE